MFSATSEVVLLDVQVIHNKTNTAFGGCKRRISSLSEDGVAQRILHRLAACARNGLEHLKPDDEVAVMVYATSARLIDGFTRDRGKTLAAIARASTMRSPSALTLVSA